jgi:hypothetical protein
MSWLPDSSMLFDWAYFVTLRSDRAKANDPRGGDGFKGAAQRVCNMAKPFAAHLNAAQALPYVFVPKQEHRHDWVAFVCRKSDLQ